MMKQPFKHKSRRFRRFLRAKEAVSALEYAILVGIVAVVLAVGITQFSGQIKVGMAAIGAKVAAPTVGTPDASGT